MLQKIALQLANAPSLQNGHSELTAMQTGEPATAVFERYFTVWVLLCVVIGVALGQVLPNVFPAV